MTRAYEEIIDFIAGGSSSEDVAEFRPSDAARERVSELLRREKSGGLSAEDATELGHYLELEHMMRLAKARARQHQSHE
ncbi:MAG: hypothetical protein JWL69_1570 [Phycisphaerales bacterium]|nr:hypothetical protein [Phycisphaerales bacterium]